MNKMPEYLASIAFRNPDTALNTLFQYAMQTEMNYFEWLHTQTKELKVFSEAMAVSSALNEIAVVKLVSELFPPEVFSSENWKNGQVLVVDVGGGRCKMWNEVRKARPDLKGRVIVQDLSKEIERRGPADGVEIMAYDFFTAQLVKSMFSPPPSDNSLMCIDAHTYFFRHVIHDWPDSACRSILRQTVSAMKKGYSRLIIVDVVLPNVGASLQEALMDINMIYISGMERTER
jgi:hypothetical protein